VCLDSANMNRFDPDIAKLWAARHARSQ